MYEGLKHAHSGFRWIFLILLIYTILNAFLKWKGNKSFTESDRKANLFTFIFSHIQLLIGSGLYFISPKVVFGAETMRNAVSRFFTVEHILVMIIGVTLISMGYLKAKQAVGDSQKFQTTFIYFLIALLLILSRIPWPFQQYGASWF